MMYGKWSSPVASSSVGSSTTCASKISWILSPTSVVDRLRVELAGDRVLHAVDQRQLGVPLPRLVHQPRVLERHAQTAGQRLQQLLVRLAERVLAVDVLQRDHARRLPARDERHEEHRLRCLAGRRSRLPYRSASASRFSAISSGSRVSSTCLREADRRARLRLQPLAALDHVREVQRARSPRRASRSRRPGRRRSPGSCRRPRRRSPAASSSPAIASCTLLISASSAFRCRVSCTSRAFSSATLRLPASVVSRRTSFSSNAFVRSRFCSEIRPRTPRLRDQRSERAPTARARPHDREGVAAAPARGRDVVDEDRGSSSRGSACGRRHPMGVGSSGKRTPLSIVYG